MSVAILFMGIASPLFTMRMEVSVNNTLDMTSSPREAKRPANSSPAQKLVTLPAVTNSTASALLVERQAARQ